MTINEVMTNEREAILAEYVAAESVGEPLLPYVGVTDPQELVNTPSRLRARHPVSLEPLPGRELDKAFVQVCPSLRYKFLWAHVDHRGYRDDYKKFLRLFHAVTEELSESIIVDHVYNRKRGSTFGARYARLMLLTQYEHKGWGPSYEAMRSRGVGASGRQHKFDDLLLLKANGMPCPRKGQPLTAEMMNHIQRVSALYGIPITEILASVERLREVADFRPESKN